MIRKEDIELARGVNLPSFLEHEFGLVPSQRSRTGVFYHSPFRSESHPSLHVSYKGDIWVWYDHGSVEKAGGDAIELLRRLGYSFAEAVEKLSRFNGGNPGQRISCVNKTKKVKKDVNSVIEKFERIRKARELYERLPDLEGTVRRYFAERGLRFHGELGCRICVEFSEGTRYIVFPVPYPSDLRGLEMREIVPVEKEISTDPGTKKRRRCRGVKTLWVYKRDPSRLLITESILDALAGEMILDDQTMTLVSLNGVNQAGEVEFLIKSMRRPEVVYLSLDRDECGYSAERIVYDILKKHSVKEIIKPVITEKDLFREYYLRRSKQPSISK